MTYQEPVLRFRLFTERRNGSWGLSYSFNTMADLCEHLQSDETDTSLEAVKIVDNGDTSYITRSAEF